MAKYLKHKYNTKIVLFAANDVYGQILRKPFFRRCYLKKQFKWCLQNADKVYSASVPLAQLYRYIFGIEVTPLYKGCSFQFPIKVDCHFPIRIIYAGNLFYGRDETIMALANVIDKINLDKALIELKIFTTSEITDNVLNFFNNKKGVIINNAMPL